MEDIMITKKLGIIGCGNMGGAILYGALESGVIAKENVFVYDINPAMREKAAGWGVTLSADDAQVCRNADIILLAVKPQQAKDALAMCGDALNDKAMMSIVAGITTERLQAMIDGTPRILRIMPNTPAMVYEGAFALCSDNDFTEDELAFAKAIYDTIGIVEMVPEHLIDAVCGLSGGGPAYAAMFIEAMADGGVKQGLPRATAYRLAAQTCLGTAKMILETDIHPGQIKDMVTSPAGTTIEGCEKLETGGMRGAVMECIKAATERSKEL
jgi:pyrroline-5-carboxylate reductase